jgi:hypothetical protein
MSASDNVRLSTSCSPTMSALVPVQEHDQTARIAIGQRPQQHSIDHGEDGRRRPDAEGQGENRDAAERRLEPQRATSVAQILKQ